MECMCAQTRPYSHLKEFWGMESEPMLTSREKSPLPKKNVPQRRIEPMTLHQAGQQAQHTTNELFRPPLTYSQVPIHLNRLVVCTYSFSWFYTVGLSLTYIQICIHLNRRRSWSNIFSIKKQNLKLNEKKKKTHTKHTHTNQHNST